MPINHVASVEELQLHKQERKGKIKKVLCCLLLTLMRIDVSKRTIKTI